MKEYFARLYLSDDATLEQVKVAYRKLAKKFHPDRNIESNDFEEEFKLIQDAYEKIIAFFSNIPQKKEYNKPYTSTTEKAEESNRQRKQSRKVASKSYFINGALFNCRICRNEFWAIRSEKIVHCPYCKNTNFLLNVKTGSINQEPGAQKFSCHNCEKIFYSDRIQRNKVICPHCKTVCTLPNISSSHNIKMGFINYVIETEGYNCGNCQELFYADRKKVETVICPHCKTECILPSNNYKDDIKMGFVTQISETQGYYCGNCQNLFYADRNKVEAVICPHCKIECILPNKSYADDIKMGFVIQISETQGYYCGNCQNLFYADRNKVEAVICPHCKTECTLPDL
jgi:DnaJ-class molecular chaperone